MIEQALRWLEIARQDFRGTRLLLSADPSEPPLACFHAQQAAEKSLKAALVLEGIDPPRTHDLNELRELLPAGWEIPCTTAEFERISKWAEQSRYFNGWEELIDADALWGIAQAQAIYDSITAEFVRRGVAAE